MSAPGLNLLVFRDGRRQVNGRKLQEELVRLLVAVRTSIVSDDVLEALLQAGELECALADRSVESTDFKKITDVIAAALVGDAARANPASALQILQKIPVPTHLEISVPEGFAYYGLHPLAYCEVLSEFATLPSRVVVCGIRSIGTTLSAVTAAALRKRGVQAVRTTVRPTGHPYNRRLDFSPEQLECVRRESSDGGMFLVVDEGPGLSGSSFLAVAEALVRAGADRDKIVLIGSHAVDVDHLCAENAARRWREFRFLAAPCQPRRPAGAEVWIGAGEWRLRFLKPDACWPGSWLSFERMKYMSGESSQPRFYKFAGFGRYGYESFCREEEVASAGFGPEPRSESDGYVSYPVVGGKAMTHCERSSEVLARLAKYCVFRGSAFAMASADIVPLQQMAQHNLEELGLEGPCNLMVERPVIPDGRMQPHEWLLTGHGQMLKTDSGGHGDDHFFPGTTDIAWDLAGAIVEWQMSQTESEVFLDMYHRFSGDNAQHRIADYLVAYSVFRSAYCLMAANAVQRQDEQGRLRQEAIWYKHVLCARASSMAR